MPGKDLWSTTVAGIMWSLESTKVMPQSEKNELLFFHKETRLKKIRPWLEYCVYYKRRQTFHLAIVLRSFGKNTNFYGPLQAALCRKKIHSRL